MNDIQKLLVLCLAGGLLCAKAFGAATPYKVAYASFGPLNTGIFIANADGSHERMLVASPVLDANPSFSPDGRWVLFTSRRDGSADIYRVHVDGTNLERLTDDPSFDDQAVMSPDGTRIAFVSSRSGQADIWLLDVRTRALRNLTNHRGGEYRPAWSPDGHWIAFTSDRDSDGALEHTGAQFAPRQSTQLYLMRADGSEVRRLTHGELVVGGASWSPDSKEIVFFQAQSEDWIALSRTFPGGTAVSQIVSLDIATGTRTARTTGLGRKFTPQWLADGRIAYLRSETEEKPDAEERVESYWSERVRFTDGSEGPAGIFTGMRWSADGKRIVFHRIVDKTFPMATETFSRDPQFKLLRTGTFPSFSPDGVRLVCTDGGSSRTRAKIFMLNVDGSHQRVLYSDAKQSVLGPVWSPTGHLIAFGRGIVHPRPGNYGPSEIVVIAPDGSGARTVTPNDGGNYGFPSWSPDGKRLVLRAARPTSKGLSIVDLDSAKLTPLTSDSGTDNLPAWSPNGNEIVFTSRRDGDWELYSIRPDGTGLKRLTHSPGNDAHASWSPDGQWIAFSSARGGFKDEMARGGGGQGATDVFVMRSDGTDVRRLTDDAAEEGTTAFAWKNGR